MEKDSRNNLHIFYLKDGQEIHDIIDVGADWRSFSPAVAEVMYNTGMVEVCKHFNVSVEDELPYITNWCWDRLPIPDMNKVDTESDNWKLYYDMYIKSECACAADSMLSQAYIAVLRACKHNGDIDMDDGIVNNEYKDIKYILYLFERVVRGHDARTDVGAWILPDGSYLAMESSRHRCFVEEFLGLKEFDIERLWVKISLYKAYTHPQMTKEQWVTLNRFLEKYEISQAKSDWYEGKFYV